MSYIELNEINDLTNQGKSVFQYYFPNYQFRNKEYLKLRSEEKTASTRINFHDGLWRITDFGNQKEVNSMTTGHLANDPRQTTFCIHLLVKCDQFLNYQEREQL